MKTHKILLVDDDPILLKIGSISLSQLDNCELLLANSGLEGINIAQMQKPDLILLDVIMPELDGIATYRKLTELSIDIPVIFMTANDNVDEIESYRQMGVLDVIIKPINPREFPQRITQILNDLVVLS
jgi:CheY-like chemotaxis protein